MDLQTYSQFKWLTTERNAQFVDSITTVRKEVYQITPNVKNLYSPLFIVSKQPKRYIYIEEQKTTVDLDGCELEDNYIKHCFTNIQQQKNRIRKKVLSIASIVDTHPKQNSFFITLTIPNYNADIRSFLNRYFMYLKTKGISYMYYFWVLEFGKNSDNPHYHIVVTLDKPVKDFNLLKPDLRGWIGHTEVQRVRKSVYRYMCKYMTKETVICLNHRNVGFSQMTCCIEKLKQKRRSSSSTPTKKLNKNLRSWKFIPKS